MQEIKKKTIAYI